MANDNLVTIASLGRAVPRSGIVGLKLEFDPTSRYRVVFPESSMDPIEVEQTENVSYRLILKFRSDEPEDNAGPVEVSPEEEDPDRDTSADTGEQTEELAMPAWRTVFAVLAEDVIPLRSIRRPLAESEPYIMAPSKRRATIDKRVRMFREFVRGEERFRIAMEDRQRRMREMQNVSSPDVDIMPDTSSIAALEMSASEAEKAKHEETRQVIQERISRYSSSQSAPLSFRQMQERLGEDSRRLDPAITALRRAVADLNA